MSAWSEAVWIVKQMQKNFDFTNEITYYTQQLNDLNQRVNTITGETIALTNDINNTKTKLESKLVTFISETEPSTGILYANGAIWFIIL